MKSVESILTNTVKPFHLSIIDNSHGGLENELSAVEKHPKVTVYRNEVNYGKGAAFNQRYPKIMTNSASRYFISIDGDICVPPKWLYKLESAYTATLRRTKPGIIAPAIFHNPGDTFELQLQRGALCMHNMKKFYKVKFYPDLYYNRYTAGPLFLIDRNFFENVGGYYDEQLYGADDGRLCAAAAKQSRFIGIYKGVHVQHLLHDVTPEYAQWKRRNIVKDVDGKGHWD